MTGPAQTRHPGETMILDALTPLFVGPLEAYRDRIVSFADARPGTRGDSLIAPEILAERLALFARNYEAPGTESPDMRAVASIWSKHHFSALIVPTLAVGLVLGRALPVALAAVEVVSGPDGRTVALKVQDTGQHAPEGDRFGALVEGHIRPLATALAAVSGLAPRVIWGNAGNVLDATLRQVDGFPLSDGDGAGFAAALTLIRSRRLPDGRVNPLFDQIRDVGPAEARKRQRKVCCLRYLIPAQTLCATCPLTARPA